MMSQPLLPDDLWHAVEPAIPKRPRGLGGRPPLDDRKALTGILFVLKHGISWGMLPLDLGCGCGMTCWRRLRDWREAGAWDRLQQLLSDRLHDADQIDWSRAEIDRAAAQGAARLRSARSHPTAFRSSEQPRRPFAETSFVPHHSPANGVSETRRARHERT